VTSETDGGGARTDFTYDEKGNLVRVVSPANNAEGQRPETSYSYDELGRVVEVHDPLGRATAYQYDRVNRVTSIEEWSILEPTVARIRTEIAYDLFDDVTGLNYVVTTDFNGHEASLGFDVHGRLVSATDALEHKTQYLYDRDLLSGFVDANGNVTAYTYDSRKRRTATIFSDGLVESYSYFPNSALRSRTDRKGQTISYSYDRLGRLVLRTLPGSGSVAYRYSGQNLSEVIDTSVFPADTHAFTYDESYRLSAEEQGSRGSIEYEYLEGDRLRSIAVVGGETSTFEYFADGSVAGMSWSPVSGQFSFAYDPLGQLAGIEFPNGQQRVYEYDKRGRLVSVTTSNPSGFEIATFEYRYDTNSGSTGTTAFNRRTGSSTSMPSSSLEDATAEFYFDAIGQLREVRYPPGEPFNGEIHEWSYDALGNRLSTTVNGESSEYTYTLSSEDSAAGQRLLSDGFSSFSYDGNGNTTMRSNIDGTTVFSWNGENRLVGVSGLVSASMQYDYLGRRVVKSSGEATSTFLYRDLDLIAQTGEGAASFVFGPDIDQPLAMIKDGDVKYFVADGLGTIVATTDVSGTPTYTAVYGVWGNLRAESGHRDSPFGYTAREMEEWGGAVLSRAVLGSHHWSIYSRGSSWTCRRFESLRLRL
jgi:YD repeat-containing protein